MDHSINGPVVKIVKDTLFFMCHGVVPGNLIFRMIGIVELT